MSSGWTWLRGRSVKYYFLREMASRTTQAISLSSICRDSGEPITECDECSPIIHGAAEGDGRLPEDTSVCVSGFCSSIWQMLIEHAVWQALSWVLDRAWLSSRGFLIQQGRQTKKLAIWTL